MDELRGSKSVDMPIPHTMYAKPMGDPPYLSSEHGVG